MFTNESRTGAACGDAANSDAGRGDTACVDAAGWGDAGRGDPEWGAAAISDAGGDTGRGDPGWDASALGDAGWGDAGLGGAGCVGVAVRLGRIESELAAIRAVIEASAGAGLGAALVGEELADATVGLYRLGAKVAAVHRAALSVVESSQMVLPHGAGTVTAWVKQSHVLDHGPARAMCTESAWLAEHRLIAAGFAAGEVSAAHVRMLCQEARRSPHRGAALSGVEQPLVVAAARMSVGGLRRWLRGVLDAVDPLTPDRDAADAHTHRGVWLAQVGDVWDLRGTLPADTGGALAAALHAHMDQVGRADPQSRDLDTPAARRADALVELVQAGVGANVTSSAGQGRTLIHVLVPAQSPTGARFEPTHVCPDGSVIPWWLLGPSYRVPNGPGAGPLAPSDLQRLTCDGWVQRFTVTDDSVPVDVGRRTRLIPPALRAALEMRDGGCVIPGCDRPPGWCQAHHVIHWSHGGPTDQSNLALICARHHTELHQGHWHITMINNQPHAIHTTHKRRR